jgi:hypothetical protein
VKLTRRQLVVAAAAGSIATVTASAQPTATQTATDLGQSAGVKIRQNADTLTKFSIPITTEPAFQFKA